MNVSLLTCCRWILVLGLLIEVCAGGPPVQAMENRDVAEGGSIKLSCRFEPSLVTSSTAYFWTRGSRENAAIRGDSFDPRYSVDFSADEGKYDLVLSRVRHSVDNGPFECWLKEKGSGKDLFHKSYHLTVLVPPGEPKISPPKPVATEGEAYTLTCSSTGGNPEPMLQWYKDGAPLQGHTQKQRHQATTNTLTIVPTLEDDNALFQCTAWNRAIQKDQRPESSVSLQVYYSPRVSVGAYNPLSVLVDTDAVLNCHVMANPPAQKVRWMRGSQLLSTSFNHTIPAVTPDDEGVYKCIADNGIGDPVEAELKLAVLYHPIVKVIDEKEASEGDDIEIFCDVKSNPPALQLTWFKKDDPHFQQSGNKLRLRRVTAKDTGTYTCVALTVLQPSGKPTQMEVTGNASVRLHVQHAPGEASIEPSLATAIAGRPFTFTCSAKPPGWPTPDYRWWREGDENRELSRRQNLSLASVTVEQEGRFFCQPENSHGRGSVASVYLTVNEPLTMRDNLPPHIVKQEETVGYSISCKARGKPQPRVRWLKDGIDLAETSGLYQIVTTDSSEPYGVHVVQSTLKFEGASRRNGRLSYVDRGKYVCQFDNGLDQMTKSEMMLRVEHSPIVQHSYNRVAYDPEDRAVLECKMQAYPAPNFEWYLQNRLIENYGNHQLNVSDNGADIYTATLVIKRLTEHDYGDYTCKASNRVGDSKKTIIRLVRKSAPDRPLHLEVVDVHWDRITLKWVEGFNGGFSNTEYLVTYTNLETGQTRNESCRSRNLCEITGLNSKTEYSVKVLAINSRGYSDYSDELHVATKVSLADLPRAAEAQYDELSRYVYFTLDPSNINLVAKIEARTPGEDWRLQAVVPAEEKQAYLPPPPDDKAYADVRVTLCLKANDSWCGNEKLASFTNGAVPYPPEIREPISVQNLIVIIVVTVFFFVVAMVGLICCLRKKDKKADKKDYSIKAPSMPPQPVSPPAYYPEPSVYTTSMSPPQMVSNGGTETGSQYNGNPPEPWMKANDCYPPPVSYEESANFYYPNNYQPLGEDEMNARNTNDYLAAPFYDVSGLPDPYAAGAEEDNKNHHVSFDESLESGYSTPNSRSRRIIREIIV